MSECSKCGDIEPQNHDESWWRCSCHDSKPKNLDSALKFIGENFEELWGATNE